MLTEKCMFAKECDICQGMQMKLLKNRPFHLRIPVYYSLMESLSVDIKLMLKDFADFKYLLVVIC